MQRPDSIDHVPLDLIFDAHCHFHLDSSELGTKGMHLMESSLGGLALMSTQQVDWETLHTLKKDLPHIQTLFGIHPWFAHHYSNNNRWCDQLRKRLISSPHTAIGEIGLDRKWRPPDTGKVEYQDQMDIFTTQLKLAGELSLPVSIHCVQAQGDLYHILSTLDPLPPALYLHAFGGAKGTAEQLIRSKRFGQRLYFGFASCVNLRSPKTREVIRAIPEDRLLIESDRSSAAIPHNIHNELIEMLQIYTDEKNWVNVHHAALITRNNALRFYQITN